MVRENEQFEVTGFSDVAIARAVDSNETSQVTTDLYTEARRCIDYVIRVNPVSFLKGLVWKSPNPSRSHCSCLETVTVSLS